MFISALGEAPINLFRHKQQEKKGILEGVGGFKLREDGLSSEAPGR